MEQTTLVRDRDMLISGDIGSTLPELRQAYSIGEIEDMAKLIEGE